MNDIDAIKYYNERAAAKAASSVGTRTISSSAVTEYAQRFANPVTIISGTATYDAESAQSYCERYAGLTGEYANGRVIAFPADTSVFLCRQKPLLNPNE